MLGNFHEISVHSEDVMGSLTFYQALGFGELETGDVWEHAYAVVSDGSITIGLHQHAFDSPALTFVRPELEQYVRSLKKRKIEFAFEKLADDEFNEAGFADPSGIIITLLEAQTHRPPLEQHSRSLCGQFLEVSVSVDDLAWATLFWENIGFEVIGETSNPHPATRLRRETLSVGLHQARCPRSLCFLGNDLDARSEFLEAKGFTPRPGTPMGHGATLLTPDGTQLFLFEEDWI